MSFTYCISDKHNGTLVVHEGDTCPLCDALKPKEPKLTVRVGYRYNNRNGFIEDVTVKNKVNWHPYGEYKGMNDGLDLIEELGPTPLEIKVGKRYEDSRGNVFYVYKKDDEGRFWLLWEDANSCHSVDNVGVSVCGIIRLLKEVRE